MNAHHTDTAAERPSTHESRQPGPNRIDGDPFRTPEPVIWMIRRCVDRLCRSWDASDREDMIQSSLLKLLEGWRRSRPSRGYNSAYLARLARSVVADEARRRRRRSETPYGDCDGEPSPVSDPERLVRARALFTDLEDALCQLSSNRRVAVELALRGLSMAEVAEEIGGSVKRAENLITRGRADLRRLLAKQVRLH